MQNIYPGRRGKAEKLKDLSTVEKCKVNMEKYKDNIKKLFFRNFFINHLFQKILTEEQKKKSSLLSS